MDAREAPAAPRASVVVVNWNGAGLLRDCLDSLLAQSLPSAELEIVVVDNGSVDESRAMLAADYPTVRVLALPENLGFAGGANVGIERSTGTAVVLLNNDAAADPGFVSSLLAALDANQGAAAVTGHILLAHAYSRDASHRPESLLGADGSSWSIDDAHGVALTNSTGNELTRSFNGRDRDWLVPDAELDRRAGSVPGFSGGAVAIRRSALDEVGLFHAPLFMYYEDSDLSWRLRRAGWEILYEPAAVVRHQHAASSGTASEFFLFHNERNRLIVALRNAPYRIVVAALARTLAGAARSTLRGDGTAARRKLRALSEALAQASAARRDRREIDARASVPRAAVAALLVDD